MNNPYSIFTVNASPHVCPTPPIYKNIFTLSANHDKASFNVARRFIGAYRFSGRPQVALFLHVIKQIAYLTA